MEITNTTFSQNQATSGSAGAIRGLAGSTTTIVNATIAGNSSTSGAGALGSDTSMTLRNSIVADNTGANCSGTFVSEGGNVVDDASCSLSQPSDIQADPGLSPLADNGGPTQTHAISSGSPAIDRGTGCPAQDQRGVSRSTPCDSGAFELQYCKGKAATVTGTEGNDRVVGTMQADVIAGLAGNDVVKGGGGNDLICGGAGNDKLSGGSGNDKLRGEVGKDKLRGGSGKDKMVGAQGKDTCIGGGQTDRARTCEKTRSLA
jgi:Ca2+-binding RTX toxin-like protein